MIRKGRFPLCQTLTYELLFKTRFPKGGLTYRRQVVNQTIINNKIKTNTILQLSQTIIFHVFPEASIIGYISVDGKATGSKPYLSNTSNESTSHTIP